MSAAPVPDRAAELIANYGTIHRNLQLAAHGQRAEPRLVAVSKLKPSSDILGLYNAGVRHFGENYVQELVDKAQELPADIRWHFIGALQSNKCKLLASVPNLYALETLSTIKSADLLAKALASSPLRTERLNVFLQINTSGEDAKAGLPVLTANDTSTTKSEVVDLALHILTSCPQLRLKGLMVIGSYEASTSSEPNPDFTALFQTRVTLTNILRERATEATRTGVQEILEQGLELSMGMSNDYQEAIQQGSTNVRVGSNIFGTRPPRPSA